MQWLSRLFIVSIFFISGVAHANLPDFRDLVKESSAGVVNISTVKHARKASRYGQQHGLPEEVPEIFRHFFGMPLPSPGGEPERSSLGSGFIVSDDGYILTNNHVVQGADEIIVRLNDRRELKAELIGADPSTDMAVLKVEAKGLPVLETGDSEKLEVGEWVVAIGSPFGFDYSVTAGIVSAKGRSLPNENYVPFIQTDVAINPGNSGGPLFNLDGEVVGINSQIYTRSGGFMGVSFAIPINVALDIADQLKADGSVSRGWLGVVIQDVNRQLAESFGLDKASGALVAQVMTDSPADNAGIESGDIIVAVDGKEIIRSADLPHHIGSLRPSTKAEMTVIRNGKEKTIKVKIGRMPNADEGTQLSRNSKQEEAEANRLGVVVSELTAKQRQESGNGVLIKQINKGAAAKAGIIRGDIISMIAGEIIRDTQDFERVVGSLPTNRSIAMRIVRRGQASFIPLKIED